MKKRLAKPKKAANNYNIKVHLFGGKECTYSGNCVVMCGCSASVF